MRLLLSMLLAVTACGQEPLPEEPERSERLNVETLEPRVPVPPGEPRLTNTAGVRGAWRVREVSGRMLPGSASAQLSLLKDEIHFVSGCVRRNWRLNFAGERLHPGRIPSVEPPCLRPLTSEEVGIERAIDQAEHLVRRSETMLFVWGPHANLVLTRPEDETQAAARGLQ